MQFIALLIQTAVLVTVVSADYYRPKNLKPYYRKTEKNYEITDSLFEGDINFPDVDDSDENESDESDEGGTGRRHEVFRWPKVGKNVIVPYEIDENSKYTKKHITNMKKAMEMIEEKTCVKFKDRSDQDNYLFITMKDDACWSYVGRVGDIKEELKKQTLNLAHKCCLRIGTMAHEMIHALGFYHMQSHPKRDEYVKINYENMDEKFHKNYDILTKAKSLGFGTPYDYLSIMHYGPMFFSNNNKPTMDALIDPDVNEKIMGQRNILSPGDIIRINEMYECSVGKKRKHDDASKDDDDESDDSDESDNEDSDESEDSEDEKEENKDDDDDDESHAIQASSDDKSDESDE